MSKYLISDLIFQFFSLLYEKKKVQSLLIKKEASYKFSEKNFCTWPILGLALKGLNEKYIHLIFPCKFYFFLIHLPQSFRCFPLMTPVDLFFLSYCLLCLWSNAT